MKTFIIRLLAMVVAVILFIGAVYTCGLAVYMCMLTNDVVESEAMAANGSYAARSSANATYESVSEARDELYYGGGYKSWFSTLPKVLQVIFVVLSLIIIVFEIFIVYAIWNNYKFDQEVARRKKECI